VAELLSVSEPRKRSPTRAERNQFLRSLIKQIKTREKVDVTLLNYENTINILENTAKPKFAQLTKEAAEKKIDLAEMFEKDYADLKQVLYLNEKTKSGDYQKIVSQTKAIAAKYLNSGDHTIYITGGVYLSDSFRESTVVDMSTMVPIVLLMIILFLVVNYRSYSGFIPYVIGAIAVIAVATAVSLPVTNKLKTMVVPMTLMGLILFFLIRLIFEIFSDKMKTKKTAGILLSLLVVICTIMTIIPMMGLLGLRFNNMTSVVPQIMIAIGIADSVHIMATFYQFLERGVERKQAAYLSLRKNFVPTLLTALSTAMGFASFLTSSVKPIAEMGELAAIGALIAWVFTYTILGPLLVLTPAKSEAGEGKEIDLKTFAPLAVKTTDFIFKRQKIIVTVFSIMAVIALVLSARHKVDSDPFSYFKEGSDLRKALDFVEKHVGAAMGVEISIDSGKEEGIKNPDFLGKVEKLQTWITKRKGKDGEVFVTKTISIVEILKSMNRTLNGGKQSEYRVVKNRNIIAEQLFLYTMNLPVGMDINDRMTIKNDAMRLTVLWKLHASLDVLGEIENIKTQAKGMGLNISVTGKQVLFPALNPYVVNSFRVSMSIAIVLVSLLLIIAFRSIKLGLLAMIPNFIPLVLGSAIIYLFGQDLDIGIVIVFAICLGIAVDDTIHFLANYQSEIRDGLSSKDAISHVLTFTAPALITTTIVLVASFGVFILATFVPNVNFGLFSAMILSIALISDLSFLPALLMLIGAKSIKN